MVERIANFEEGTMVGLETMPEERVAPSIANHTNGTTPSAHGSDVSPIVDLAKTRKMDDIERHAILYTLQMTQGNVVEAARILGLGPATVYRKIKRYGVRAKALATLS
ncbi:hypothetical protein K2Y11_19215 [bacterium]|nr:hypothetical protein [bacterium]